MENRNVAAFERLSVPRLLAKFIIPAVVSQLSMLILNLTDAFFVGRTGDTYQISAMTICYPIMLMIGCVATIFGAGGNANIAAALGAKDRERAKRFSVFAVYTPLAVVAALIVLLLCVQDPLLYLCGADDNSIGHCRDYLLWVFAVGGIPSAFMQVMSQLYVSEGETRVAGIGVTGAGILNIVLDPLFIFGLDMGVAGAALATCLANCCASAFFLCVYWKKRGGLVMSLDLRRYTGRDGICRAVLAIGLSAGVGVFLLNCCDFFRNALLSIWGGQEELAAWGVAQKVIGAFIQIILGILQGVRPLVAYNYTAGAGRRTRSIINGAFLLMLAYAAVTMALMLLIPKQLVGLFLPMEDAQRIGAAFMRVWAVCMLVFGCQELINCVFQAVGRWRHAMGSVIASNLLAIALMLILAPVWGSTGVVAAAPLGQGLVTVVMLVIYIRFSRRELSDRLG